MRERNQYRPGRQGTGGTQHGNHGIGVIHSGQQGNGETQHGHKGTGQICKMYFLYTNQIGHTQITPKSA